MSAFTSALGGNKEALSQWESKFKGSRKTMSLYEQDLRNLEKRQLALLEVEERRNKELQRQSSNNIAWQAGSIRGFKNSLDLDNKQTMTFAMHIENINESVKEVDDFEDKVINAAKSLDVFTKLSDDEKYTLSSITASLAKLSGESNNYFRLQKQSVETLQDVLGVNKNIVQSYVDGITPVKAYQGEISKLNEEMKEAHKVNDEYFSSMKTMTSESLGMMSDEIAKSFGASPSQNDAIAKLIQETDKAAIETINLSRKQNTLSTYLTKTSNLTNSQSNELTKLAKQLIEAGKAGEISKQKFDEFSKKLQSISGVSKTTADEVVSSFVKINNTTSVKEFVANLVHIHVVVRSLSGAFRALKSVIVSAGKGYSEFETLRTNLYIVTSNAQEATKQFKELQKMASVTPFNVEQLTQASVSLQQVGIRAEKVKDILEMLGNVSGGSQYKLQHILQNYTQIVARGKTMEIDIREFANMGIPIRKVLKEIGVEGNATAEQITQAFRRMTEQGGVFYNGMNLHSKTLNGLLSTLSDSLKQASANWFDITGLGEGFKSLVQGLIDKINNLNTWMEQHTTTVKFLHVVLMTLGGFLTSVMLVTLAKIAKGILMDTMQLIPNTVAIIKNTKENIKNSFSRLTQLKSTMANTMATNNNTKAILANAIAHAIFNPAMLASVVVAGTLIGSLIGLSNVLTENKNNLIDNTDATLAYNAENYASLPILEKIEIQINRLIEKRKLLADYNNIKPGDIVGGFDETLQNAQLMYDAFVKKYRLAGSAPKTLVELTAGDEYKLLSTAIVKNIQLERHIGFVKPIDEVEYKKDFANIFGLKKAIDDAIKSKQNLIDLDIKILNIGKENLKTEEEFSKQLDAEYAKTTQGKIESYNKKITELNNKLKNKQTISIREATPGELMGGRLAGKGAKLIDGTGLVSYYKELSQEDEDKILAWIADLQDKLDKELINKTKETLPEWKKIVKQTLNFSDKDLTKPFFNTEGDKGLLAIKEYETRLKKITEKSKDYAILAGDKVSDIYKTNITGIQNIMKKFIESGIWDVDSEEVKELTDEINRQKKLLGENFITEQNTELVKQSEIALGGKLVELTNKYLDNSQKSITVEQAKVLALKEIENSHIITITNLQEELKLVNQTTREYEIQNKMKNKGLSYKQAREEYNLENKVNLSKVIKDKEKELNDSKNNRTKEGQVNIAKELYNLGNIYSIFNELVKENKQYLDDLVSSGDDYEQVMEKYNKFIETLFYEALSIDNANTAEVERLLDLEREVELIELIKEGDLVGTFELLAKKSFASGNVSEGLGETAASSLANQSQDASTFLKGLHMTGDPLTAVLYTFANALGDIASQVEGMDKLLNPISYLAEGFIPLFEGIVDLCKPIIDILDTSKEIIENTCEILKPIFKLLGKISKILLSVIIVPLKLLGKLLGNIANWIEKVLEPLIDHLDKFIDWLYDLFGIKTEEEELVEDLTDAYKSLLQAMKEVEEYFDERTATNRGSQQIDEATRVNDMILTPQGKFSTHPDDYIIATKTPHLLNNNGGNGSVVMNVKIENTVSNDISATATKIKNNEGLDELVVKISRKVASDYAQGTNGWDSAQSASQARLRGRMVAL